MNCRFMSCAEVRAPQVKIVGGEVICTLLDIIIWPNLYYGPSVERGCVNDGTLSALPGLRRLGILNLPRTMRPGGGPG